MADAALELLLAIIGPMVDLIPDAGDLGISSAPVLNQWLAGMNVFVDVTGPLAFLSGMLAALPPLIGLRLGVWAYKLLPGKAT